MSDYLKEGFIDEVKGALKGEGGSGQDNVIEKIKVNGVEQAVDPNKAVDIPVPTKTSELENDEGFLTEHQDLSDYAKKADVPTVPTNVSEFTNDSDYQTADDVSNALEPYAKSSDVTTQITEGIAKVVADAPEDFDTLKEMSDWIASHENDASAMNSAIQDNKNGISELNTNMAAHTGDKNNPHAVTKDQVGLGNVDNTADLDKPVSKAQATAIADAKKAGTDAQNNLTSHIGNTNNPHSVTKSQVGLGNVGNFKAVSTVASQGLSDTEKSNARTNIGLGNVDNTADLDKPISTATQTALDEINRNLDRQTILDKFDGELIQGRYIHTNGIYYNDSSFVAFKNQVYCKENDVVVIKTELTLTPSAAFYDSNGEYVSGLDNANKFTIPSGVSMIRVSLFKSGGITPSTAGHIELHINNEIDNINSNLTHLEVSDIAGGKNILDYTSIGENFSNNVTGTSFSFSNGEYVITRVNNFNSGIYTYSSLLNVLDGKKIRLSFDAKTDTSGMSIRFCVGKGDYGYVTKELTEEYKRYASDFNITTGAPLIFYGNALAGNMYIKNIMFEDITNSESIDSTYKPYIPSVKMLAEEIDKQNASLYSLSNGTLTNITNGYYYNNGVVSSDSDSSYGIINNLQSGNELCWENANTLISQNPMLIDFFNGDTYVSQSSVTSSSGSITIPSNVTRAILSMPTTSMTTIKVTSGVVAALKKDLGNYATKANPTFTGTVQVGSKGIVAVNAYDEQIALELQGVTIGTDGDYLDAFELREQGDPLSVLYMAKSTGADYAEYFEWADKNPNDEDRVGYFVTFDENDPEKIRYANEGDYILGIVSGMPNVIGNDDNGWSNRYILDEFGRRIEEELEYEETVIDEETGEETTVTKTGTKWKENPDYDDSKPYAPRKERPEWSAIGMLGVLSVYDDGTCQVNGYCKCSDNGVATSSEDGYRIIARVSDNIIKIVFR